MTIDRPIFIIGAGRSGSTAFHRAFSRHPNLAWLAGFCGRYPDNPSLNRFLMKALDYPVLGKYAQKRFNPWECYRFWEHYCKGFSAPCRDLVAEDVTNKAKRSVQGALAQMLTAQRNRLLIKITGWPRIGFLREIFPDAKFIHIVRDGRAVVNSTLEVPWWEGWGGPQGWRAGELTLEQRQEWEAHNESFVALAALEWKILMDTTEQARECVAADSYLEVKYEKLCTEPVPVFQNATAFCGLDWSPEFETAIKTYPLRSANDKWKKELTPGQQSILEDVLGEHLKRYGYS